VPPEERFDPNVTTGPKEGGLGPTRSIDPAETAGTVIDRYHLLQKVGEGGMGEIWLAEQKEPVRRRVALKLVKAGMNTREVIARFESERQALALMDHPAIAKVFDAGSTPQGAPYFVMEYVAGVPITTYCDNHRLNTRDRIELFMHVCEGVQHAHQKAIIHRDLKPSNILVTEVDGRAAPKIIDFGVAKALSQRLTADTVFTRVGELVGTPEYMSPEQALSSGEDIDTRTDVYSLGIIFYELLAGVPPIDLRKIAFDEFLRRLREEEPLKPSTKIRTQDPAASVELARKRHTEPLTLTRQIRGDLDSIALKALEKDRSRRYGSPSDFAADIARYLKSEAVLATPPSAAYRARKFVRRHRAAVVTACVFALVLITAATVSISQSIRATKQAREATSGRLLMAAVLRNDTQFDLAALLNIQAWRSAQTLESANALLSGIQASPQLLTFLHHPLSMSQIKYSPDGRTLVLIDNGGVSRWDVASRHRQQIPLAHSSDVAFSPDGRILVASVWQGSVSVWQEDSGGAGIELWREQPVADVSFSSDGKLLATTTADNSVSVWDIASHRRLGRPLRFGARGVAFSADGKLLASGSFSKGAYSLRLLEVESRRQRSVVLKTEKFPVFYAFSPDGKTLAFINGRTVQLWDIARLRQIGELTPAEKGQILGVAFSADGKILASSVGACVLLWDVSTRSPIGEPLRGHAGLALAVAFSPDGKTLASNTPNAVQLWDLTGQQSLGLVLQGHRDSVESVAFSPDGQTLASASSDKTVRLWNTSTRQLVCRPLEGHEATVWSVAFSPYGQALASASNDKTVRLWNALNGQALGRPLRGHNGGVGRVAFSPNGKVLASASGDETVRLWDLASGRPLGEPLKGHRGIVNGVAFSPDGKLLASAGDDGTVRLWVVSTRQPYEPLFGHGRTIWSVAFSPDGRLLAAGTTDGVRLWDVTHGTSLDVSMQGQDYAYDVTFSPDGRLLATGSSDGVVRLWDIASRRPFSQPLQGHESRKVTSVAFSPDGRILASASWDKTIRLWDVGFESWAARLCSIANRNLSLVEWREYMGPNIPYALTCPLLPAGGGVEQR